ncbi:alkaline phosphatase family protein [Maribacter hydrothermalis]|uniref:Phosphodiesterase n=1 Tax=Maribacter hydrothermalis TaxID=1836467 RepID=A0A1B7ZBR3_9FLAO|nr:nucleotide pyrophosphatase/phosphodiesterase family protein [Maribacter hydrothermalis]APQ16295.1 alkaline phosphatase family protein [Maribacter hydrothermalis]OBR40136.1 phosphodiesterase [Maribacter hydrothermalis]
MKKTVVINVVGLTKRLIGEHTPYIKSFLEKGQTSYIEPLLPGVTCAVQSTYVTGKWPSEHGIVGNGWYFKDECEVKFWRQSNKLVEQPKIWDDIKEKHPNFTCANHFWWYNMYSNVDYSLTPRPNYLADGRKIPDIYSYPAQLRDEMQTALGTFPLFEFWGPKTTINSSKWIADAALLTDKKHNPDLTFIYLPHLDYNLQRYGLDFKVISKDLNEIDAVVKELVQHYEALETRVILLSEYGITNVNRPIHLNRLLRKEGFIAVREERGLELLDAGASDVFAVADHQIAHVYCKNEQDIERVAEFIKAVEGVEKVLYGDDLKTYHINHERCGDIVVVADKDSWFTYYFWLDDSKAPDYARMVDIHKKPGYDPVEMMTDPKDKLVMAKVVGKLLKKKMGFRTVMNIIPIDATLIKGSHGRLTEDEEDFPIFISNHITGDNDQIISAVQVRDLIEDHLLN